MSGREGRGCGTRCGQYEPAPRGPGSSQRAGRHPRVCAPPALPPRSPPQTAEGEERGGRFGLDGARLPPEERRPGGGAELPRVRGRPGQPAMWPDCPDSTRRPGQMTWAPPPPSEPRWVSGRPHPPVGIILSVRGAWQGRSSDKWPLEDAQEERTRPPGLLSLGPRSHGPAEGATAAAGPQPGPGRCPEEPR